MDELGELLPGLIGGAIGGAVGPVLWHHHRIGDELAVRSAPAWRALGVRGRRRLLRGISRGRPPEDPSQLTLAADVAVVQRRLVERRGLAVSNFLAAVIFAVAAVVAVAVDRPILGALAAVAAMVAIWSVVSGPRLRQRVVAAEQRCHELADARGQPW